MTPQLLVAAHGTRFALGNAVARHLADAAARRLGVPVGAAYVELCQPLLADELAESRSPAAVLPLLLSTGFHVRTDLPVMAAAAPVPVSLGRPLGPDPLLADAQVGRLLDAGARRGQPVVMVAAGSRDPGARDDLAGAAALLAAAWGGEVRLATVTGTGDRVADLVRPGVAVSPYLLAPGHFAAKATAEATAAGATHVAGVLGAHQQVVALVVERLAALAAGWECAEPTLRPAPVGAATTW